LKVHWLFILIAHNECVSNMVVISLLTNSQVLLFLQNQGYNNTYYVEPSIVQPSQVNKTFLINHFGEVPFST